MARNYRDRSLTIRGDNGAVMVLSGAALGTFIRALVVYRDVQKQRIEQAIASGESEHADRRAIARHVVEELLSFLAADAELKLPEGYTRDRSPLPTQRTNDQRKDIA
jgi:hypothetical protein